MYTRVRNYYSKKFIILDKINMNDDKFDNIGDNFSYKVKIFLDKYRQIGLLENAYIQYTFIILLSQTQTYYYVNCDNNFTFNQFYSNIQLFFKSSKY